jgi:hypothetical protein
LEKWDFRELLRIVGMTINIGKAGFLENCVELRG